MINTLMKVKLVDFLKTISIQSEYYRGRLNVKKLDISNVWDYYNELPLLKKDHIMSNIYEFVSFDFKQDFSKYAIKRIFFDVESLSANHDKVLKKDNRVWTIEFTTGSTGKPFPIIKSARTRLLESMYLLKKRKMVFSDTRMDNGFLFLHPTRKDIQEMNIWEFKGIDMEYIVDDWFKQPPKWIFATPRIFFKYAEFLSEHSKKPFIREKLQFIEYTSQPIELDKKKLITEVFNCNIINNYGSREFWNIAYQCRNGNLHLNDTYLIVSIVDGFGKLINEYGKVGEVVITSLINLDIPLIKYYLGDRAKIVKNECNCGCNSDIIELLSERENERLKNTPYYGSKVFRRVMRGIYFHDLIDDIKCIKIIQDNEYHISVYLDKVRISDKNFEKRFIERTNSIVPEFQRFKVTFIYSFPFLNEDFRFKEVLFKSLV